MRLDRLARTLIVGIALALPAMTAAAGDAENGRKLVYTCMGCHGIENYKNAYPKYSVPRLGGQNAAYIVAALNEYAAGDRWHPTMKGFASTLSAEDRADLAAWFAAAAPPDVGEPLVGTLPAKAEPCTACHGKNGKGMTEDYPDIGGQHADYLAQALNDYRLGKRRNMIMAPFAQQLTHDDIDAIADYFSKQPGLHEPKLD
jgi:cytochrome c553